jgi:pimeloyl-ACP methyl ester carboxylesterase
MTKEVYFRSNFASGQNSVSISGHKNSQLPRDLTMKKRTILLLFFVFAILGYFSRPWIDGLIPGRMLKKSIPELAEIYEPTVMLKNSIRNPVIVIPGMMGSKLQTRDGRTVWGVFDSQSIDPDNDKDARLLSCPIDGTNLDEFDDGVYATGVLDSLKISIAGLALSHQAYLNILRMLGVGRYRDEELGLAGAIDYGDQHFTCFQFPYDWRRDNASNAKRLHEFLLEKKSYIEAERKRRFGIEEPVKFDIVAHSMGGLLARYYLRYGNVGSCVGDSPPELNWSGAENVDRVIMIATPNSGSVKSLVSTHEGFSFSVVLDSIPSGMVATLPSIYQLLPNGPEPAVFDEQSGQALDHYDIETWDRRGWGMLNPNQDSVLQQLLPEIATAQERRAIAKAHVAECLARAKRFHQLLNVPAVPPAGTTFHLFAGDAIPTASTLNSHLEKRTLTVRTEAPGDRTVTRRSTLADQRTADRWLPHVQSPVQFRDVRFLFDDHFGLTRDAEFTDNALYLLLEDPTKSSPSRLAP